MEDINIELVIEPGTSFEFLAKANNTVAKIRALMMPLKKEIIETNGYITVTQRQDGNYGVRPHSTSAEVLREMERIIFSFLADNP